MPHQNDKQIIGNTKNTPRFFVENRHVAWVVLVFVLFWGAYGYLNMPQRKDPEIPVRIAVAVCQWPGMDARQIDELVTRKIEETIAKSTQLHPPTASDFGVRSVTMNGVSLVYVSLQENVDDTEKVFNDINLKKLQHILVNDRGL